MPTGWVPGGAQADPYSWRYDLTHGEWVEPGTPPRKASQLVEAPPGFDPRGRGQGFQVLLSPPGVEAPPEALSYTPVLRAVHGPGVPSPVELENLSVVPAPERLAPVPPIPGLPPVVGQASPTGPAPLPSPPVLPPAVPPAAGANAPPGVTPPPAATPLPAGGAATPPPAPGPSEPLVPPVRMPSLYAQKAQAVLQALLSTPRGAAMAGTGQDVGRGQAVGVGEDLTEAQTRALRAQAGRYVGTPYQLGGNSLTRGIDCSGFVNELLKGFGANLPGRPSTVTYRNELAAPVSWDDIRPGDILLSTANPSNPTTGEHMALYVGGGQMAEASTGGVRIGSVQGTSLRPYRMRQAVPGLHDATVLAQAASGDGPVRVTPTSSNNPLANNPDVRLLSSSSQDAGPLPGDRTGFLGQVANRAAIELQGAGLPTEWAPYVASLAAHESGFGQGRVASQTNNLFSITRGTANVPSRTFDNVWEVRNGQNTSEPVAFRTYPDWPSSVHDFVNLIARSPIYERARQAQSGEELIQRMKDAGYATDPNWAQGALRYVGQVPPVQATGRTLGGSSPPDLAGIPESVRGAAQHIWETITQPADPEAGRRAVEENQNAVRGAFNAAGQVAGSMAAITRSNPFLPFGGQPGSRPPTTTPSAPAPAAEEAAPAEAAPSPPVSNGGRVQGPPYTIGPGPTERPYAGPLDPRAPYGYRPEAEGGGAYPAPPQGEPNSVVWATVNGEPTVPTAIYNAAGNLVLPGSPEWQVMQTHIQSALQHRQQRELEDRRLQQSANQYAETQTRLNAQFAESNAQREADREARQETARQASLDRAATRAEGAANRAQAQQHFDLTQVGVANRAMVPRAAAPGGYLYDEAGRRVNFYGTNGEVTGSADLGPELAKLQFVRGRGYYNAAHNRDTGMIELTPVANAPREQFLQNGVLYEAGPDGVVVAGYAPILPEVQHERGPYGEIIEYNRRTGDWRRIAPGRPQFIQSSKGRIYQVTPPSSPDRGTGGFEPTTYGQQGIPTRGSAPPQYQRALMPGVVQTDDGGYLLQPEAVDLLRARAEAEQQAAQPGGSYLPELSPLEDAAEED